MSGDERAWLRGELEVPAPVLAQVEEDALRCYPEESCGFLMGPAETPALLDAASREPNLANRYHALDPETFPRTATTYFKIDELRAARIFDAAEAEGRPVKVIYHSHCDAGDYFSDEDAATFARDGALMWPCAFLVVSVKQGRLAGRRLWVHEPGTQRFVESPLTILPA
ncbi:MAG: hypothetical protein GXP55_09345 [Deltaproteobacteria bacterium]|nr:hypothetical protein [Deltaproteobacteria bacterium]